MSKFPHDPGYQAFRLLQVAFVIAPIVAGLDKFFNLLMNWAAYLSPLGYRIVGRYDQEFMYAVGVIEVIAGIGVLLKPKWFAYVIAFWLFAIIINLLFTGTFYDIILRDIGLMLAALALGRLSGKYQP